MGNCSPDSDISFRHIRSWRAEATSDRGEPRAADDFHFQLSRIPDVLADELYKQNPKNQKSKWTVRIRGWRV
jgi:hypothetical protein